MLILPLVQLYLGHWRTDMVNMTTKKLNMTTKQLNILGCPLWRVWYWIFCGIQWQVIYPTGISSRNSNIFAIYYFLILEALHVTLIKLRLGIYHSLSILFQWFNVYCDNICQRNIIFLHLVEWYIHPITNDSDVHMFIPFVVSYNTYSSKYL